MSSASEAESAETGNREAATGPGYPTCAATCAREYVIPLPTVDERKRRLILLDGTFTSSGKRVVGIAEGHNHALQLAAGCSHPNRDPHSVQYGC